jgi:addiction module HigA family antidote
MMVSKRRPTHPGQILKHIYLEPLGLSITELARRLGASRKAISAIVNERKSVTPDMALRLAQAFSTTPELWLNLQRNHDLWQAAQNSAAWQQIEPLYQPDDAAPVPA